MSKGIIGIELYPHHRMLTIASKLMQIYLQNSLTLATLSLIVVISRNWSYCLKAGRPI